ncbi:Hypothetical protein PENO1_021120 [Penicillium occitanis (nom. inval.)]|nr:Hypothetical protein PENO1_021120 [Penicillium occitanis (nom. inval.)]PCH06377.1 hypothetical protein PENOC_024140 [Penicillium occitanis (nom. inval.)]
MEVQEETINLNSKKVSELLRAGADVNAAGGQYGSAIQAAGYLGRDAILETLFNYDVDYNSTNAGSRNPDGQTALSLAAESGHNLIVRQLLARDGIKADLADNNGRTPLSWAAGSSDGWSVIEEFLKRSDVDAESKDGDGRTPFSWAAGNGRVRVVDLLLKRPDIDPNTSDTNGRTPLSWAAGNGHHEVVNLLLKREDVTCDRADVDGRTPLSWAAEAGKGLVVDKLLGKSEVNPDREDKEGKTPLSWAAEKGNKDVVYILLFHADVNHSSTFPGSVPPLWRAAMNGHDGVVEVLLAAENININHKNKGGTTLLSWAAASGRDKVVKLLMAKEGLTPDSPDRSGRTALSWAAETGRGAIVEILLKRSDVNPNSVDHSGCTPLLWAAMNGHSAVVELLLAKGVNPDSTDNSGRTPLLWALINGHNDVSRSLIRKDTTTLHSLVQDGDRALTELLLATGYDVNRCDPGGTTALRLAIRRKDREMVELLLENGAVTRGVMANEWLDVYGRKQTDIIQLLEGANGQKHVSFIERSTLANTPAFSMDEKRLVVFPIDWQRPDELILDEMRNTGINEFRVFYAKVNNHATRVSVLLWFPDGNDPFPQQEYFNMPRWPSTCIAWTILSPSNPHIRPWQSVDYYSMLPNGWIPDDGIDFFQQIVLHLEERWISRLVQLRSEGKNPDLMRQLAQDAQKWTELRSILQDHTDTAQKFIVEYSQRYNANRFPKDLQNTVDEFKAKISHRLDQLDQTIRDLLQFEFAWASINESRVSTRLGHNVMLFTYVSIFYLPLAFCAAIWAIPNIADSDTRNPFIITSVIVGFITLLISFNLENITTLGWRLYEGWRTTVVKDMQFVDDDLWRERGNRLESINNPSSSLPSEWWLVGYWFWRLGAKVRSLDYRRK